MTREKFTISGPAGAKLHIDESQAFAKDPGNGTPALVEWRGSFGTFWCVEAEGYVDDVNLPASVMRWLRSKRVEDAVESIRWEA